MHRLTKTWLWLSMTILAASPLGCGGDERKKAATAGEEKATGEGDEATGGGDEAEDAGPAPGANKETCTGFDIGNLEDLLAKSDCEVPNAKPESIASADLKGKLDVTLSASPTRTTPSGKVDLLVTFANKTKDPMPLQFRIDPVARFETETYDAKGKRADMPPGKTPPMPKGFSPPPPAEQKVAKVTIAPNGSARVRVPWEAVKMKWAPEKVRGSAVEKGYPRTPGGPLAKGKYTVRVVTPLLSAGEEAAAPKVDIEVEK
jgi:hypothetical protein